MFKLSVVVYYIFFFCLFLVFSEVLYWCEMKNRLRYEVFVLWKVMNLIVLVGGKKKYFMFCCMYGVLYVIVWELRELLLKKFLIVR